MFMNVTTPSVKVIGHRGNGPFASPNDQRLHENSLYGFKHALRSGSDGIELDIHLSADGTPHVIHDNVIGNKISKPPELKNFTDKNIPSHLFNHYSDDFIKSSLRVGLTGHQVPTLNALLTMVAAHVKEQGEKTNRPIVNIELKDKAANLPERVISAIREFKNTSPLSSYLDWDQIHFGSFNHGHLSEVKKLEPQAQVIPNFKTVAFFGKDKVDPKSFKVQKGAEYLPDAVYNVIETAKRLGAKHIDLVIDDIRSPLFEGLQQAGLGLYTSTSYARVTPENGAKKLLDCAQQARDRGVSFVFKADDPFISKKLLNATGQSLQELRGDMAKIIAQRLKP